VLAGGGLEEGGVHGPATRGAAAQPAPDNPERDPARDIEHTIRQYVAVAVRHACLTRSIQQRSHVDPELRSWVDWHWQVPSVTDVGRMTEVVRWDGVGHAAGPH
jgi:hypothetical protein